MEIAIPADLAAPRIDPVRQSGTKRNADAHRARSGA